MTINAHFNHFTQANEQDLIEDLIIEAIQIYGHDVFYCPRTLVAFDELFGEDRASAFKDAIQIEMYVDSVMNFEGQGEFISKFGLEIRDEMTLSVAVRRFKTDVTGKIPTVTRPREGDLIYIPMDASIFEIMFVEDKPVFYQLGRLYTYQIKLKRYETSSEDINTGIPVIDDEDKEEYLVKFTLTSGFGDYTYNETVEQAVSGATGRVQKWNQFTNTLTLKKITGTFVSNQIITGSESMAAWLYDEATDQSVIEDGTDDNDYLQTDPEDNVTDIPPQERHPYGF